MLKDKKDGQANHLVTDNDVAMLYRRPESLSDWLPWVDFDEASQTFTLEDGYSAAAMFEIVGVSTEARSERFLEEVQANIQTCINHTIPAHDNPFVLQCYVSDEDSLSALSKNLDKYARDNQSQSNSENQRLTKNFVGRMQRHFKHVTVFVHYHCHLYLTSLFFVRQRFDSERRQEL